MPDLLAVLCRQGVKPTGVPRIIKQGSIHLRWLRRTAAHMAAFPSNLGTDWLLKRAFKFLLKRNLGCLLRNEARRTILFRASPSTLTLLATGSSSCPSTLPHSCSVFS